MGTGKFVITGAGRCGTGYMAQVLRQLDLFVGHENVFNLRSVHWKTYYKNRPEFDGDCSWLAVPSLGAFEGTVIHLVREPIACIRSLISAGTFIMSPQEDHYTNFQMAHCPKAWDYEEVPDRAAYWYVDWNQRAEKYATKRYQIENIDLVDLCETIGHPRDAEKVLAAAAKVSTKYNARPPIADNVTLDYLNPVLRGAVKEMARTYGYEGAEADSDGNPGAKGELAGQGAN